MSLHFNYWRVRGSALERSNCSPPTEQDFLDIGVMVTVQAALETIRIYLPLTLERNDVEDLGALFKEPSIATGIFNERLAVVQTSSSARIDLERQKKKFCRVYRFSKSSNSGPDERELQVEPFSDGTQLTITDKAINAAQRELQPGDWIYFRIRVSIPIRENRFVKTIEPQDKWLLSGYDSTEYVDFRLNEARNLPDAIESIMEEDGGHGKVHIKRVDFLLVVGVDADLVGGHRVFHKSRLLETELWGTYVGNGKRAKLPEGMVIYHWRDRGESGANAHEKRLINDFNAFVKLRIRRSNKRVVRRYLLIAFVVGAIGSVLGNVLWSGGSVLWSVAVVQSAGGDSWQEEPLSQPLEPGPDFTTEPDGALEESVK